MAQQSFPHCFGCGQDNPIGLKLKVQRDGDRAWAEFTPGEYHSGFPDMVHGGLLCALMDEVMSYLPHFQGLKAVTGKMEVRFHRPARPGQMLRVAAEVVKQRPRLMEVKGTATCQGEVMVEAIAHIFILGRY